MNVATGYQMTNTGTVAIEEGSTIALAGGTYTQSAGSTTVTGSLSASEVTVNGGTLSAEGDGSLGSVSKVTVNTGGTLLLGVSTPANDRIGDTTEVELGGGTFETGGFSETVGALTLTADSTLDLGAGTSYLTFDGASSFGSSVLTILNWSGTVGSTGGTDRLLFTNSSFVEGTTNGQIVFDIGGTRYDAEFRPLTETPWKRLRL